jgi:hypothetical protein
VVPPCGQINHHVSEAESYITRMNRNHVLADRAAVSRIFSVYFSENNNKRLEHDSCTRSTMYQCYALICAKCIIEDPAHCCAECVIPPPVLGDYYYKEALHRGGVKYR